MTTYKYKKVSYKITNDVIKEVKFNMVTSNALIKSINSYKKYIKALQDNIQKHLNTKSLDRLHFHISNINSTNVSYLDARRLFNLNNLFDINTDLFEKDLSEQDNKLIESVFIDGVGATKQKVNLSIKMSEKDLIKKSYWEINFLDKPYTFHLETIGINLYVHISANTHHPYCIHPSAVCLDVNKIGDHPISYIIDTIKNNLSAVDYRFTSSIREKYVGHYCSACSCYTYDSPIVVCHKSGVVIHASCAKNNMHPKYVKTCSKCSKETDKWLSPKVNKFICETCYADE